VGGALAPHIPNPHSQALQIAFTRCSSENMNSNFFSLPLVLSDFPVSSIMMMMMMMMMISSAILQVM
jgi:hypothetical protein